MEINQLSIAGCFQVKPDVHKDIRGAFFEWFQDSSFVLQTGEPFNLAQANCSISQEGVVRGIHFTSKAPGQSKLVTVFHGKVLDVIVDLRKTSPTFGKWESILIDSANPQTLYIPWGIGHGFMALEDNTVFAYLCDQRYNPSNEFDLNAMDPQIAIEWPKEFKVLQSEKDKNAPFLKAISDLLPN